jgi:hypothetical protein
MEDPYFFKEFSDSQRRLYQAAVQVYAAFLEAAARTRRFRGGVHWKNIKGRQYLYQYVDRYGHGKSLGPRSPHTEELFARFTREKRQAAAQLVAPRGQLAEQARFCRAAWLQRVPKTAARILRCLEQQDFLGENFVVIGANAIHAYEFAAGVFLASGSVNLCPGPSNRLTLATDGLTPREDLLGLLRKADRSFAAVQGEGFRAVSQRGYQVQVLEPWQPKVQGTGAGEARSTEGHNLHYLVASPKFSQVVIGQDGAPAPMVVPDPRAFALHQLWLSEQDGREETQRVRDRGRAMAVADLVLRYLPQYHFFSADLRRFPPQVVRQAADLGVEY